MRRSSKLLSILVYGVATGSYEPPWTSRRLQLLRGWSHGKTKQIFTGSERTRSADGFRPADSARISVVSDSSIASKIGCTGETLRTWVRQAERDAGKRAGLTTDERQRLKELERDNRELKRANEILRKASAFFAQAELDRRPRWPRDECVALGPFWRDSKQASAQS